MITERIKLDAYTAIEVCYDGGEPATREEPGRDPEFTVTRAWVLQPGELPDVDVTDAMEKYGVDLFSINQDEIETHFQALFDAQADAMADFDLF